METSRDHPLVRCLADGYREITGWEPEVGEYARPGNVGDGNVLAETGIPSVQFGSSDIRIYHEWPTADGRVLLSDLSTRQNPLSLQRGIVPTLRADRTGKF